jgi:hypothetical protein
MQQWRDGYVAYIFKPIPSRPVIIYTELLGSRACDETCWAVMGDPDKAANEFLKAVDGGQSYLRMLLGADCMAALEMKIGQLQADLEAIRAVCLSVDVNLCSYDPY